MKIRNRKREYRTVQASTLIPNPLNWRRHPKPQRDAMQAVLAEVGDIDVLKVVEGPDGLMLIDGHLRSDIMADATVDVVVLDLDEAEQRLVLATFDPLSAMAQTDLDLFLPLAEAIEIEDETVKALLEAVANNESKPLLNLADPDPQEETFETGEALDAVEVEAYEAFTKRGQVWQLGEHRLMCGDVKEMTDVVGLMGGEKAEVLWTDPPYGVSYVGGTAAKLTIANDSAAGISELLQQAFFHIDHVLAESGRFYIMAPPGPLNAEFRQRIATQGWRFHIGLVWVKDSMVLGHSDYHVQHEDILYGWKPGPGRVGRGKHVGSKWYGGHDKKTVFQIDRPRKSADHPTMKPVELVEAHVSNSSKRGDVILDPFVGSGTTIIAAEKLGRRCYAMEIESRYCDVAIRRWEDYAGQKATLTP